MTVSSSLPMQPQNNASMMQRVNEFLDKHVLPFPVRFLTNRITILATLCLLVPLILLANVTVFVLATNSYLNVMSVVVSSTVLLYSTISEARDRAAAARREEIAKMHEQANEARAQADHEAIQLIHEHLDGMNRELLEHVSTSLQDIQNLLLGRINDLDTAHKARVSEIHEAMLTTSTTHREQIADLHKMLGSMRDTLSGPSGPPTND